MPECVQPPQVNAKCDVVIKLYQFLAPGQIHTQKAKPMHPSYAGCNKTQSTADSNQRMSLTDLILCRYIHLSSEERNTIPTITAFSDPSTKSDKELRKCQKMSYVAMSNSVSINRLTELRFNVPLDIKYAILDSLFPV